MKKKIQPLSPGVVKKLRSGVALTSVAHCVEELVLNSIDADANCIAIHLNLPFYQLQVIDNGCGIDKKQMEMIGTRYATSKCHSLEDLKNIKSGGFRGEALSSLKEVSSVLMIESRAASSNETYCKIFTQGKSSDPKKSLNSRPSKGTTVSVYDFMYNMPVRKNCISEALDLEECRKLLQSIALMHPNISFTLKNETTGEMCLQLKKCTSLYHAFHQMFGKSKASNLKTIDYQENDYEIHGCISTDCHISKDLQFLYINKRRVLRTKLHKLINSILNKILSSKQKSTLNVNHLTNSYSPSKNQGMCFYAINISCPYDKYDIIFEPRKTMIEFTQWHIILKVVESSLIDFLKRENLYFNADEPGANMLNFDLGVNVDLSNFDIQDCRQGLFSNIAHRLQLVSKSNNSKENFAFQKTVENKEQKNLEKGDVDISNTSILSVAEEEFIPNCAKNTCTSFKESSLGSYERNVKSSDQDSSMYPNKDKSNISVLDILKSTGITAPLSSRVVNSSTYKSDESEFRIPCRSVFPSKSPVMLRVPIKSTLSDLQTSSSNSNFLKLKEKFRYLPKKEKMYPLNDSKFDRKNAKICLNTSKLSFNNNSLQNHIHLGFNKEKYEAKLNECNQLNFMNKSSQCPSVSLENISKDQCKSICDTEGKEIFVLKTAKDKSLQCPSLPPEKKRIVSRFVFMEEQTKVPLQRLRQSSRLERNTCNEGIIAAAEDILGFISDDNEICKAKKLKYSPYTMSKNSDIDINNTLEEIQSDKMHVENLTDARVSSEIEFLSNFHCPPNLHDISENISVNSSSEVFISKTEEIKIANLRQFECATFNLQTFTKVKNVTKSVQSELAFTELDSSHSIEKNKLLYNDKIDNCISLNNCQNFSPNEVSVEVINDLNHLKENRDCPINTDSSLKNSTDASITENKLSECEMSKENGSDKNMHIDILNEDTDENMHLELKIPKEHDVEENTHLELKKPKQNSADENMFNIYSKTVSSDLHYIKNSMHNSNPDVMNSPSILNFPNKSSLKDDKIAPDIQLESSSAIGSQNQIDVNVEENSFSPVVVNFNKIHSSRNSSSAFSKEKSLSGISFVSNSLTEHLSSVSEDSSLKQNSQENNSSENLSNCIFQELSTEPPFSELLNMDIEISKNNEKFNNSNTSISLHSNFENVEREQNERKNSVESENSINPDSTCSGMNDIALDTCCTDDIKTNDENPERDLPGDESKSYNRWKMHSEPESKRKIYIDTVTGNSAYMVPQRCEEQIDQNLKSNNSISKKSHFFLTHDYSPFISKTQTPENKFKDNYSGVQNDLMNFIENNEKHEWCKKWRIPQESSNLNDYKIENMLTEWDNPMFDIPYEVTSITDSNISLNISKFYSFLNSYRFSKSTLSSLQVIGQVDCKFIACILQDFNENCRDQRLLALFDQHAVHERIRLEELIEDLYKTDQDGEKSVKTSTIYPPLQVTFDEEESRLLNAYNEKLQRIGIHMNNNSESHVYNVHSVPACLVHKENQELRRSVSDSIVILQNSVKEWLTSLLKTRSIPQVLPKTLLSVLNYQACRGAVKFGDPLSLEQCKDLMRTLSACKLPFQCAHGRPSVTPLLDLKKIETLYKKRSPPQLLKLSSHFRS